MYKILLFFNDLVYNTDWILLFEVDRIVYTFFHSLHILKLFPLIIYCRCRIHLGYFIFSKYIRVDHLPV